jgi:regulator of cell morphogenesis and NO signaling
MTILDLSRPTHALAVQHPGLAPVLQSCGLSRCFSEQRSMADILPSLGLNATDLQAQTAALIDAAIRDVPVSTIGTIDYILRRYHDTHRRDLAELILLADKVEMVHADDPKAPHGLAVLLAQIEAELESHMQKEEQILFPLMKSGGHPMIAHPIAAMMADHDSHADHLAQLEALTHGFTPPAEACGSWRALINGVRALTDDLIAHMHLENTVLFPRFL